VLIENSRHSSADLLRRISTASSVLVGLSVSYGAYVLFLQTPAVSLRQLALAIVLFLGVAIANYFFTLHYLKERLTAILVHRIYAVSLCFFLPLLFLPLFYRMPNYPINPLLQKWTDIRLQYELSAHSRPFKFSATDVILKVDKDTLNAAAFTVVSVWKSASAPSLPSPGSTTALHWFGPASSNVTLAVRIPPGPGTVTVYWDKSQAVIALSPDSAKQYIVKRQFATPWGVGALLYTSAYILISWLLLLSLVLFDGRSKDLVKRAANSRILLVLLATMLAVVTVILQLHSLLGGADSFISYINGEQLARHNAILQGQAPDPWQYRVFSEYLVEGFIRLFQILEIQDALVVGFVSLRILQNLAIFLLALALYGKVSGSKARALMGLLLLASTMKNAFYDSDLSFNTYFDLIFYLLAFILILNRQYYWIILVTALAALNRETGGLIPFLALAALVDEQRPKLNKLLLFVLPAAAFAAIFIGLHVLYPNRPLLVPYGRQPGIPLLIYNVTRSITWDRLFYALGLIPVIALLSIFDWPRPWQRFFLIMCPVWFAIHFVLSVVGETRLFLVPQAVIFIPGVLFTLGYFQNYSSIRPRPPLESSVQT
jgi:hypothetical protein